MTFVDHEKERRLHDRSLLRLTRLYSAVSYDRLLTLHDCALDGIVYGYSHSQRAPDGYHARLALLETELKRRQAK